MNWSTVHRPDWFKDAKSGHIGNYSCWRYFNVPKKCTRVNGPIAPGVLKPHVLFGPGDSIDILDLRFRRLEFQTVLVPRFFQKHFFFFRNTHNNYSVSVSEVQMPISRWRKEWYRRPNRWESYQSACGSGKLLHQPWWDGQEILTSRDYSTVDGHQS